MTSTYVPAVKKDNPRGIVFHVLLSIGFSTPIMLSSTIDKIFFEKNKLPYLSVKDIISLFLLTTTTTYTIDYLQFYDYIPQILKFQKYISGVKIATVAGGVFFLSRYVF